MGNIKVEIEIHMCREAEDKESKEDEHRRRKGC